MLPFIIFAEKKRQMKPIFTTAIAVLLGTQALLYFFSNHSILIGVFLLLYLLLGGTTLGCMGWLFTGPLAVGLSSFFLSVQDGAPRLSQLFDGFNCFGRAFLSTLLMGLFIVLWCLLFVIPAIIKTYSYAMTFFIIADDPSAGALEAITRSRQMMAGNKWRLACLYMRFAGWGILCLFTFGIGFLWLCPYMMAATAAFYRDIKEQG